MLKASSGRIRTGLLHYARGKAVVKWELRQWSELIFTGRKLKFGYLSRQTAPCPGIYCKELSSKASASISTRISGEINALTCTMAVAGRML